MAATNIQINLVGDVFSKINILTEKFNVINKELSVIKQTNNQAFLNISKNISTIKFGTISDSIRNIAESFQLLTTPGIEFQQKMAELSAITGIAGKDLEELGKKAREVGKNTGLGAAQAAEAFKLLASNIDVSKIGIEGLKELQEKTILLSHAAGVDLPTAANTMAGAINQFGLEAQDASKVVDILANGAKYGAAEVPDLAESLKYVGTSAGIAGMKLDETVAALEILSQNSLKGSMAGTSLNNAILKIQSSLGISLKDGGLFKAIEMAKPHINDASWMIKHFGEEGARAMNILITHSDDLKEMTQRMEEQGTAAEQASINTNTYKHQMEVIRATIDNFKISLMNVTGSFLPFTEIILQNANLLTNALPLWNAFKATLAGTWTAITYLTNAEKRMILMQQLQTYWTKIVSGVTAIWNAIMNMNPISLIIIGITALIGVIAMIVNKWKEWGAAISMFLGPIGMVVSIVMKLREHWEAIQKAFEGGFLNGLKMVGKVLLDALLYPIQQLLQLLSKLPVIGNTMSEWANKIKAFREGMGFVDKSASIKTTQKQEASAISSGNAKKASGILPTTNDSISKSTSSDKTSGKIINVRIESLIKDMKIISQNLPTSTQKIKEAVTEALIAAVRDTEVAL